jgi:hypothetical protein
MRKRVILLTACGVLILFVGIVIGSMIGKGMPVEETGKGDAVVAAQLVAEGLTVLQNDPKSPSGNEMLKAIRSVLADAGISNPGVVLLQTYPGMVDVTDGTTYLCVVPSEKSFSILGTDCITAATEPAPKITPAPSGSQ